LLATQTIRRITIVNDKPNQRIKKRITDPDPKSPKKYGKARKAIRLRMVTISDKSSTSDFLP
jgi:hypothetical protein